jgi:hypothetical protein
MHSTLFVMLICFRAFVTHPSMNRIFFGLCLSICFFVEYSWMRHDYRSLVIVVSKCPIPSSIDEHSTKPVKHWTTIIGRCLSILFQGHYKRSFVPIVCETKEIRIDPRSIFLSMKVIGLIGLIWTILSYVRQRSTSVRLNIMSTGDGLRLPSIK